MKYEKIIEAKFVDRPNRFVATVDIGGNFEKVHIKNTGRCRELFLKGATVFLEDHTAHMGTRKLRYSLIAVEKLTSEGVLLVNMDSQAPNKIVYEALSNGSIKLTGMESLTLIKPEKTFENSRFDFYVEDCIGNKGFVEVKGVTLENSGVACFPDAPTERGVKHISELMKAHYRGYNAYVIFILQMEGMNKLVPNDDTHPLFGRTLREASKSGVFVKAYECCVKPDSLQINREVPVYL